MTHASSAALRWRRGRIRRRTLPSGLARAGAEPGPSRGLPTGDRRPGDRCAGPLLEDRPQALERLLRPPPQPAPRAELLLHTLARSAWLAADRHVETRERAPLRGQVEDALPLASPEPAAPRRLDQPPRPVGLHYLCLDPVLVERRLQAVARRRPHSMRARVLEPEVLHVVIGPGWPRAHVGQEVEHLLARRGDERMDPDRQHGRRDSKWTAEPG